MPRNHKFSCDDLLNLIGQQVVYHHQRCEIIELLDGCELVLQELNQDSNIQPTQYGEGHRPVPVTHVLPVFDGEGELHAELVSAGLDQLLREQGLYGQ
ncbi:hypothetical protein Q7A_2978 [Methylophaga nitratireducenticrescens]|jgi:hypothetical protein|nr:hypothetical protein Q7A_2978 [Methylophaga nitratireducenticrescens]MAL49404.1 hypothetical protein [Methylophaga sp.]AUZ85479.1 hypothetical protein CDW43_13290 [Methylophaga nitratireducenticrescens]MAP26291.1 hypothetical protein [Methylophaga sp.]MBL1457215.1 hypothetical protein [Methylophaga sp.]|tara:strand:- start:12045 stop:12338 length:294 start_codon:yes stop_codon:yes gene_type:complete